VNRALVVCLLGLLVERMMVPVALADGRAGVSWMSAPVRPSERLEGKPEIPSAHIGYFGAQPERSDWLGGPAVAG